jgi:hypothetical protein
LNDDLTSYHPAPGMRLDLGQKMLAMKPVITPGMLASSMGRESAAIRTVIRNPPRLLTPHCS